MQEKFPIFILIASELLDASGASSAEHRVSGVSGLSFPGEARPRAGGSPVPSELPPITEDDSGDVTIYFQTPAADPTDEMTADLIPAHTEVAARATATLLKELVRSLEGSEQPHTAAAAVQPQDGQALPSKLLSSVSVPTSTQGSQATTRPEGSGRSLPAKPEAVTALGPASPSAAPTQPTAGAGVHRGSPELTAALSTPGTKQMETPSLETSPLTSTVNFHPPRKETAASPFPTREKMAPESAREAWSPASTPPTSKRPRHTSPWVQPGSGASVRPAQTQSKDAKVTAAALLQEPASGELGAVYSRTTQTTAARFSHNLSLKQGTAGSEGRSSTTAIVNGARHTARLPAPLNIQPGSVHSSSLLMHPEALDRDDLPRSPSQGPATAAGRPQTLSVPQTLSCTKHHTSHEANRSSQERAVLVLQRDADHQVVTSKTEKSVFPGNPPVSANLFSLSQSQMPMVNLSQTTAEPRGATPALFPGTSALENAAPRAVSVFDAVHAALQPPGTSGPYAGLQLVGIPTSAKQGLHVPASSASAHSGSQVQGTSAHPGSREAFAMLQMSTVEDTKGKKSLPHQTEKAASPPPAPQASTSSSPSGLHDENQKAPSDPQLQQPGSMEAFAPELPPPPAQESQPSTTARPRLGVPVVSDEIPAHLAHVPVQQFSRSHDAAAKNLSAFGTDRPEVLPPYPYLSFLLRHADGMTCLLPTQGSPLPLRFPNTSIGSLVSVQQILAVSNSSFLDLGELQNLGPSSLVLVKPVFILFPTDRPDLQAAPSPEGEGNNGRALSFTSEPGLNTVTPEHSRGIPVKTTSSYPTNKYLGPEAALSTASSQRAEATTVTSRPARSSSGCAAAVSPPEAITPAASRALGPQAQISPSVQAAPHHGLPTAAASPRGEGAAVPIPNGAAAEAVTSAVPLSAVPARSPRTAPGPPLSSSIATLLPAVALPSFPVSVQPPFAVTEAVDQAQHSRELTLQGMARGQGSVTTPSPRSSSTMKYPSEMSTSIAPLQSTLQSILSTELLQRPAGFVPSTVPASSASPAGNEGRGSAAGGTLHSKAKPNSPTSLSPGFAKHLEFTPIVPRPFAVSETPALALVHSPFSAKVHVKTATSGRVLAAITHLRMFTKSPASPPSSASTHTPLPSALKPDRSPRAPTELFSQGTVGEDAKPTEVRTSTRKIGAGGFLGSSTSLPAVFNTRPEQPPAAVLGSGADLALVQPSPEAVIALEREPKLAQTTPQSPLAVAYLSAAANDYVTSALTKRNVVFLPTSTTRSDPNLALPTAAGTNGSAEVSAPAGESRDVFVREGEAAAASQMPLQAATSLLHRAPGSLQAQAPLGDGTEHGTGRGHPSHSHHGHSAAVPAPWPPATEPAGRLPVSTEVEEEEIGAHEATDGAAEGSVTAPVLPGSQPGVRLGEPRHQRVPQPDAAVLSGLAVVSDEVCGSGNYTVRMSLSPVADASPELEGSPPRQGSFLALLAVQSSRQPELRVRSCCVTPSSSPGGPGAVCCPLPRPPSECRHIQLLPSSKSRAAGFTIQLFQMLNHSVAYLHCELNVCLQGRAGCEQGCFGSTEPLPQPGDRNSSGNLHNLISFGPVLRAKDRFQYEPVAGPNSAMLVPVLLGSLTGFAVLGSAFISLWLHHRQKTKTLAYLQFGEIRGL